MTVKEARTMIDVYGQDTSYFNDEYRFDLFGRDTLTQKDLEQMFERKGFGKAESKCIIAALKIAGSDIK